MDSKFQERVSENKINTYKKILTKAKEKYDAPTTDNLTDSERSVINTYKGIADTASDAANSTSSKSITNFCNTVDLYIAANTFLDELYKLKSIMDKDDDMRPTKLQNFMTSISTSLREYTGSKKPSTAKSNESIIKKLSKAVVNVIAFLNQGEGGKQHQATVKAYTRYEKLYELCKSYLQTPPTAALPHIDIINDAKRGPTPATTPDDSPVTMEEVADILILLSRSRAEVTIPNLKTVFDNVIDEFNNSINTRISIPPRETGRVSVDQRRKKTWIQSERQIIEKVNNLLATIPQL